MLFEKRVYTLRPGCTEAFWKAQQDRGFDLVKPILERLVGYFWTGGGPREQIVHLYRFDSFDDWISRLHGLYGVKELAPYFSAVRPLMLAQENGFLTPAPMTELTPLWGHGNDSPITGALGAGAPSFDSRGVVVEEQVTQLLPGRLSDYWGAWRDCGLAAGPVATERLIGVFSSLVGHQHNVTLWRWHASHAERESHQARLRTNEHWQAFLKSMSEATASYETKLLTPAPFAAMSPLFSPRSVKSTEGMHA